MLVVYDPQEPELVPQVAMAQPVVPTTESVAEAPETQEDMPSISGASELVPIIVSAEEE